MENYEKIHIKNDKIYRGKYGKINQIWQIFTFSIIFSFLSITMFTQIITMFTQYIKECQPFLLTFTTWFSKGWHRLNEPLWQYNQSFARACYSLGTFSQGSDVAHWPLVCKLFPTRKNGCLGLHQVLLIKWDHFSENQTISVACWLGIWIRRAPQLEIQLLTSLTRMWETPRRTPLTALRLTLTQSLE